MYDCFVINTHNIACSTTVHCTYIWCTNVNGHNALIRFYNAVIRSALRYLRFEKKKTITTTQYQRNYS